MEPVLDLDAPDATLARFIPLLVGDPPTLRLLRHNPFPHRPARYVRAVLYRYRFTTWAEWRETGAWWSREPLDEFVPPMTLRAAPPEREDPPR